MRVSILGFNQPNIKNRPFTSWPIRETRYQMLHLASDNQLMNTPSPEAGIATYQSDVDSQQLDNDPGELCFKFRIPERVCLVGSLKASLRVSCDELDDMDIFLQVRKANTQGDLLVSYNVPVQEMDREGVSKDQTPMTNPFVYLGPHGQIRASHRSVDRKLSKSHYLLHEHISEERIEPGEVVQVETSVWPGGIVFEKDEYLVLKISGHPMYLAEFPTLRGEFKARNKGLHKIHFGGSQGSYIVVPFLDA